MRHLGRLAAVARSLAVVALCAATFLLAPSAAHADDWYHVTLTGEVRDGHSLPAPGVPLAVSFDDVTNPDSGVMITGADGTATCSHGGFWDGGWGFSGVFTLALDDPEGVYALVRTESEGFGGDIDALWAHRTFYLADAGAISGVVRDAAGSLAPGAAVELHVLGGDDSLHRVVAAAADARGRYRFAGLCSRTYAVRFVYPLPQGPRYWDGSDDPASAGLITLGQDEERTDIDGEPRPLLPGSLMGRVAPRRGDGLARVVVHVWRLGDDGILMELPDTTTTDDHGDYVVDGLDAGTYTLSVDLPGSAGRVMWLGNVRCAADALLLGLGWDEDAVAPDILVPRGVVRGPRRAR